MSELYGILQSNSGDQYVWSRYVEWRHMLDGGGIEISGCPSHGDPALLLFPMLAKSPVSFNL